MLNTFYFLLFCHNFSVSSQHSANEINIAQCFSSDIYFTLLRWVLLHVLCQLSLRTEAAQKVRCSRNAVHFCTQLVLTKLYTTGTHKTVHNCTQLVLTNLCTTVHNCTQLVLTKLYTTVHNWSSQNSTQLVLTKLCTTGPHKTVHNWSLHQA